MMFVDCHTMFSFLDIHLVHLTCHALHKEKSNKPQTISVQEVV